MCYGWRNQTDFKPNHAPNETTLNATTQTKCHMINRMHGHSFHPQHPTFSMSLHTSHRLQYTISLYTMYYILHAVDAAPHRKLHGQIWLKQHAAFGLVGEKREWQMPTKHTHQNYHITGDECLQHCKENTKTNPVPSNGCAYLYSYMHKHHCASFAIANNPRFVLHWILWSTPRDRDRDSWTVRQLFFSSAPIICIYFMTFAYRINGTPLLLGNDNKWAGCRTQTRDRQTNPTSLITDGGYSGWNVPRFEHVFLRKIGWPIHSVELRRITVQLP